MFVNDLEYSMSCLVLRVLVEQKVGLGGKALDDELILILQPFASSTLFDDFGTRFLFVLQLNSMSSTIPNVWIQKGICQPINMKYNAKMYWHLIQCLRYIVLNGNILEIIMGSYLELPFKFFKLFCTVCLSWLTIYPRLSCSSTNWLGCLKDNAMTCNGNHIFY